VVESDRLLICCTAGNSVPRVRIPPSPFLEINLICHLAVLLLWVDAIIYTLESVKIGLMKKASLNLTFRLLIVSGVKVNHAKN
jgi:hypothetical protein